MSLSMKRWGYGLTILFVLGALVLMPSTAKADSNAQWAKAIGNNQDQNAVAIATDASGNIYATGNSDRTMYVTKFDSSGNIIWSKTIGGSGKVEVNGMAVDKANNVYLTGSYEDVIDFDPGPAVNEPGNKGGADIYTLKLDTNGNFVWLNVAGSTGSDAGQGVTIDDQGYVYVTGNFEDLVFFDPTKKYYVKSHGHDDAFIVRYTNDGQFTWSRSFGGDEDVVGRAIRVDHELNIYVTGDFQGKASFDPNYTSDSHSSKGNKDVYVVKLNSGTLWLWSRPVGRTRKR